MPTNFRMIIEIEEAMLGPVVKKLNAMQGVASFELDLDAKAKPNGSRAPKGAIVRLLLSALKDGAKTRTELLKIVGEHGDASNALSRARRHGFVVNTKAGTWQLTAKGKKELSHG